MVSQSFRSAHEKLWWQYFYKVQEQSQTEETGWMRGWWRWVTTGLSLDLKIAAVNLCADTTFGGECVRNWPKQPKPQTRTGCLQSSSRIETEEWFDIKSSFWAGNQVKITAQCSCCGDLKVFWFALMQNLSNPDFSLVPLQAPIFPHPAPLLPSTFIHFRLQWFISLL